MLPAAVLDPTMLLLQFSKSSIQPALNIFSVHVLWCLPKLHSYSDADIAVCRLYCRINEHKQIHVADAIL